MCGSFVLHLQRLRLTGKMPGSAGLNLVVQGDVRPAVAPDLKADHMALFQCGQRLRRHRPGKDGQRSGISSRQEFNHLALDRRKGLNPPSGQVKLTRFPGSGWTDHGTTAVTLHNLAARQSFFDEPAGR